MCVKILKYRVPNLILYIRVVNYSKTKTFITIVRLDYSFIINE